VKRTFANFGSNSAFEKCLTPAQISYENTVVVPEQTISEVLNAPTTNISDTSYTVAGVNPSDQTTGLITKAQLVKGAWFTSNPADEVLLATSYAAKEKVAVGGKLAINGVDYTVVGTVNPTLTGRVLTGERSPCLGRQVIERDHGRQRDQEGTPRRHGPHRPDAR
jgi:hypothetical protein